MSKPPEEMSLEELLHQKTAGHAEGNPLRDRINTAIQVRLAQKQDETARRLAEKQDETARALVDSTNVLVASTSRLVRATWGLVFATTALVLVEIVMRLVSK
jgi:hypothetical protein